VHHVGDSGVDRLAPRHGAVQLGAGVLSFVCCEALVALGVFGRDKRADVRHFRDVNATRLHFGSLTQEVEDHYQRGPPIDAAPLRVEVHKLRSLSGVLGDCLEAPVVDDVGDKALLVLDLHRIECAAIRIDADEKRIFGLELDEWPCGLMHCNHHLPPCSLVLWFLRVVVSSERMLSRYNVLVKSLCGISSFSRSVL